AVAAQVQDTAGDTGVLVPAVGNPDQLVLQYLPTTSSIQVGQQVVTVGFRSGSLQDLYPAGLPIGQVSVVGNQLANNGQVTVTPAADLRRLAVVLVQTLGVTSLLYIVIGYWSGRLRELRDPSNGLVPMAMGAGATAFAGLGMAMIQFLLGVDAPVSLLLLQQIFIAVLVNTLIA